MVGPGPSGDGTVLARSAVINSIGADAPKHGLARLEPFSEGAGRDAAQMLMGQHSPEDDPNPGFEHGAMMG